MTRPSVDGAHRPTPGTQYPKPGPSRPHVTEGTQR
ncbi:hypothetical protein M2168_004014 [Streptomyces sp. CZ24]|nr:hypothetical protein [Streptomyces sp. CZ24]